MQQWHGSNLDLLLRLSGCSWRVSSICCKPLFALDYHVVIKICSGLQVTRQDAQRTLSFVVEFAVLNMHVAKNQYSWVAKSQGEKKQKNYFEIFNTRFLSPFSSCLTKVIIQVLDHFYSFLSQKALLIPAGSSVQKSMV